MDRRTYVRRLATGATATTIGLAGCGAPGDGGTPGENATGGTPGDGVNETGTAGGENATTGTAGGEQVPNTVDMITDGSDYYFDPIGLFVEPGETITFVNESGAHSTVAYTEEMDQSSVRRIPADAEGWNSEIISEQGGEFTHTFEVAGTYDYYCGPHKALGMIARIVVGEPGDVTGDPPDGEVPEAQRIVDEGAISWDEWQSSG